MLVPGKTDLWLCGLDMEAGHPTRAPNCQHGEEPSRVSTPLGVGKLLILGIQVTLLGLQILEEQVGTET